MSVNEFFHKKVIIQLKKITKSTTEIRKNSYLRNISEINYSRKSHIWLSVSKKTILYAKICFKQHLIFTFPYNL